MTRIIILTAFTATLTACMATEVTQNATAPYPAETRADLRIAIPGVTQ